MHSIFEVYDFNKDKNEFIENCTLVYLFLYRSKRDLWSLFLKIYFRKYCQDCEEKSTKNEVDR